MRDRRCGGRSLFFWKRYGAVPDPQMNRRPDCSRLVAVLNEREVGRHGRKGSLEPGHAYLLPWAWRVVSLPQASAAKSRLTITRVARRVTSPRAERFLDGASSPFWTDKAASESLGSSPSSQMPTAIG